MSRKALVVDDSSTVRNQIRIALKATGFEIIEAVDGLDGLEKATTIEGLCLILADIHMPRMSGLDMLDRIMASPTACRIPVVMLTTAAHPELIERAKAAGAKAWIVKPFQPQQLVAAVLRIAA